MKTNLKLVLVVGFVLYSIVLKAQQVIITDDATYTSPASGAMLDVKSASKGFMPPRVALTSVTDINTVVAPATGLMVYNTGTAALSDKGIYYWNGSSWVKLIVGGADGVNYMSIDSDGTVKLHGKATTYDDLRVDGTRVQNSGASAPLWGVFVGGLYCNFFENTKVQSVYFNIQMPHAWKEGSDIGAHVHWTTKVNAPGTTKVVWALEYQWVNIGDTFSTTTNSTITGSEILSTPNINTDNTLHIGEHAITSLGDIAGSGKKFSSILVCRLYRIGNDTNDTYIGDAALLSFDLHYMIDSFGTSSEFAK